MSEQSLVPRTAQNLSLTNRLEEVKQTLIRFRDQAHILTPFCRTEVQELPSGFMVSFRTLTISLLEDDGEVYKVEGTTRLALTKIGLWRLEQLAGVDWEWVRQVPVGDSNDEPDRRLCAYQARGKVVDVDGLERAVTDGYTLDLRDDSDLAKAYTPARLAKARQNIHQLAETKAKLRVLRALLGLKSSYKPEELQKPFVILKMVPDLKAISDNPILKLAYQAKALGLGKEVFGILQSRIPETDINSLMAVSGPVPNAALPPVRTPEPLSIPEAPSENPTLDSTPVPMTKEELEELERQEARESQIRVIEELYLAKKGKTRAELSPNKPALKDLSKEELDQIESVLKTLPNLRDIL